MDIILSNTILGFSHYISELFHNMIIIYSDRIEELAEAIFGSLNNILVSYIECGETSSTIDETIKHATTKLSHFNFMADSKAKKINTIGEKDSHVF